MKHSELYFNTLSQLYFEVIDNDDKSYIKIIKEIARQLSDLILKYLDFQNKQKFSENDIKMMSFLFNAPLIENNNNNNSFITRLISNLEDDDNNEYNESKSNYTFV